MPSSQELISTFILLWAVIDPIGTVPVFISSTGEHSPVERRKIALMASLTAAGILLFFILVGEILLVAMGVPLLAFQIAGGLVLFLFALTMIFGESKPESEIKLVRPLSDTAVFPLATPSLASPGAMMAVVMLTENKSNTIGQQAGTAVVMLVVISIAYVLMVGAGWITRIIGQAGASIISRVMGLILASIATANVLEGLQAYFQ